MPRIYRSDDEPLDFCKRCFPKMDDAEEEYGDVTKTGEGPDERGNCFAYNSEHPPYAETDYRCQTCDKPLMERDD
jgi:hypothetical protein